MLEAFYLTNKNLMLFNNKAEYYGKGMVCQFHGILKIDVLKILSNSGDLSILRNTELKLVLYYKVEKQIFF